MTIKSKRILTSADIRSACVANNFCNACSNDGYNIILAMGSNIQNLTDNRLYKIALMIYNNTSFDKDYIEHYTMNEIIASIMFTLTRKTITTYEIK